MPLGNLTSQFFANVYLNELDYFIKHNLKAKYYIRYVDDFLILHSSAKKIQEYKEKISAFLIEKLNVKLHSDKTRITSLHRGIDFVGFRNYRNYKLLRKRNIRNMRRKMRAYKKGKISFGKIFDVYHGWKAYAMWGNSHKVKEKIKIDIIDILLKKV